VIERGQTQKVADVHQHLTLDATRPERERAGQIPARTELVKHSLAERPPKVPLDPLQMAARATHDLAKSRRVDRQAARAVSLNQVIEALAVRHSRKHALEQRLHSPVHHRTTPAMANIRRTGYAGKISFG